MEELLGGHNEKALDKALKEQFVIKDDEIDDIDPPQQPMNNRP